MGLGKKDIIKNIVSKTQLPNLESSELLESFIVVLKSNIGNLKIARFGTFSSSLTPERLGRNPKTLEEFVIKNKERVSFKPSKIVRKILN